jgi:hypothetical protein
MTKFVFSWAIALILGFSSLFAWADDVPMASPSTGELAILSHMATTLDQVSSQLIAMQQSDQQNWGNYFKLSADMRFSAQSYPEWVSLQKDFSMLNSRLGSWSDSGAFAQSGSALFNSQLSAYATDVDKVTLNTAMNAINQLSQRGDSDQAMADAVSMPLSSGWQQQLAESDPAQINRTISVQLSTNNALLYELVQQSQAQQVLLSRLLVEMTQMNQAMLQLNSAILKAKSNP